MRILLIQAKTENPEGPVFPMGLASLTAVLRARHDLRGVDLNLQPDIPLALATVTRDWQPQLIGFSLRNIKVAMPGEHVHAIAEVRQMISALRAALPGVPVLIGGAGFSLYAETLMQATPELDFGLIGEGEISLPRFLEQFPDPAGIQGLLYRRPDGALVHQGLAPRPVMSTLPPPDRTLFPVEHYKNFPTAVGVMTKRGCPFQCIHCSDRFLLGPEVRCRPIEDVVDELRTLRDQHGVTFFMFADQEFNLPVSYTKDLLRAMIEADLHLSWTAYFTVFGLDDELVQLFQQAGCSMLSFSPDLISDSALTTLKKGITTREIRRAVQLIRKHRMHVTWNFMLGLPGETPRVLWQTLWFILQTKLVLGRRFRLHGLFVVPARIYPHTELEQQARERNDLPPGDDLTTPRFARAAHPLARLLDRMLLAGVFMLWSLKRRLKPPAKNTNRATE